MVINSTEKSKLLAFALQKPSREQIRARKINKLEKNFRNAYNLQKEFNQLTYVNRNRKSFCKDSNKALEKYKGLCHAFCALVAMNSYTDELIDHFNTTEDTKEIDTIALKGNILELMTIFEWIFAFFFKLFPASLVDFKDRKNLLKINEDGDRIVNLYVMNRVLNKMENNQYIQLFIHRRDSFGFFEYGHATLIFKTVENNKTYYNFFDPNMGFAKMDSPEQLSNAISDYMNIYTQYNSIDFIDLKQILERSHVCREMMRGGSNVNRHQTIY